MIEKSGLAETFTPPKTPAVPAVEGLELSTQQETILEEAVWPSLVDPIDDPANYNGILDSLR